MLGSKNVELRHENGSPIYFLPACSVYHVKICPYLDAGCVTSVSKILNKQTQNNEGKKKGLYVFFSSNF